MEFVRPNSAREHGVQDITSDFKKAAYLAPFRPHVRFIGGGLTGGLHREELNAVCPIKIGWEFHEITRGSEAPTPQAEPLEITKNRVNTFLAGLGFYTSRIY